MNVRRTFLVALMAAAVSGGGSGGSAAAAGAASPDFTEVVRLVQENSQQRAKALGGDRHAVVSLSASSDRDTVTGLSFSNDAADREGRVRKVLSTGEPLVAGSETLQVGTGTVSVELVDTQALKSGAYVLTLLENVEYPYTDDPRGESMGESYERRVTVSDSGSGWKVLKNEVPSGNWPLVEGATAFESSIFTGQGTSGLKLSSHTNNRRNVDASWWAARGREDSPEVDYDYFHLDYGTF